jgi:hypothetical protein
LHFIQKKKETRTGKKTKRNYVQKPVRVLFLNQLLSKALPLPTHCPRRCHYRHIAQGVAVDRHVTQGVAIGLGSVRLAAYLVFFLP